MAIHSWHTGQMNHIGNIVNSANKQSVVLGVLYVTGPAVHRVVDSLLQYMLHEVWQCADPRVRCQHQLITDHISQSKTWCDGPTHYDLLKSRDKLHHWCRVYKVLDRVDVLDAHHWCSLSTAAKMTCCTWCWMCISTSLSGRKLSTRWHERASGLANSHPFCQVTVNV